MAVKFNLVEKLVRRDMISQEQLVTSTIFGTIFPDFYDETKIYNKGDLILSIDENGNYVILVCLKDNVTGPFDPKYWAKVSFADLFKDGSILAQNNAYIRSIQEGMADDTATLVFHLAGLLDNAMEFNQIFRENFKNDDNLNLITGVYNMGSIETVDGVLEFQFHEPKAMELAPKKYKLKHYIELMGVVGIECQITFNGLDENPFWFNANDAVLDGSFFEIPEFEKEDDIPYALNIRIRCNGDPETFVKISDLMVVFI